MAAALTIAPGEAVQRGERLYEITRVIDFDAVLARDQDTGEIQRLAVAELQPPMELVGETPKRHDLQSIPDDIWQVAQDRFEWIRPLLDVPRRTVADVERQAELAGVNRATIYRWLDAYERSGLVSALLPPNRKGPRDKKLSPDVEKIVETVIQEKYLTKRKASIQKTYEEVERQCRIARLVPPHYNTVRNRIRAIPKKKRVSARVGKRTAAERYDPVRGKYPDAKWPLAVIQIDHTQLPVNVLDDKTRQPIGKPWLTLAIEVYSRMVAGFYLSLDPPSAAAVGLCLSHAILPKETWLAQHEITTPWPIWGIMDVVHADNAKEFRGKMQKRACKQYSIDLYWRPVKDPKYGGHIERLLGTFKKDLRDLAGAVGKDDEGREDYRPEKDAQMTTKEVEKWLATYITGKYHQQFHTGIQMAPIKKYELGIFGDEHTPGRGLPPRILDEDRLRIDFLPSFERTVQTYGIVRDHVHYYGHVLNRWINAEDPNDSRKKRAFRFNYFPPDMSTIYFFDPEIDDYFEVPFRDTSRPPVSEWELRAANRWLKNQGIKDIDEQLIFDTVERLRHIESEAAAKTKSARRAEQRRRDAANADKPKPKPGVVSIAATPLIPTDITPFEDMEEYD